MNVVDMMARLAMIAHNGLNGNGPFKLYPQVRQGSDKSKTYVFISYARSDAAEVANLLQRRLEGYRILRKLVGEGVPLPESKYLRRVFVDTEDLSVSSESFLAQLRHELDDAEYLIVLCSKAAARSDSFVHKEIEYFTKKKDRDNAARILPIALDGVGDDAVPEELREIVKKRNIVLWDRGWPSQGRLGKAHLHSAFFKVLEFLLGVDAGVLNNRYWITWRRKIVRAVCVGAAVMLALVAALTHDVINQIHRVKFEKQVFPLSIDYSYMEAFAAPLIAQNRGTNCIIIAAMPKDFKELENKPWQKKEAIKRDLESLGWEWEDKELQIPNWQRPLVTAMIRPSGRDILEMNVYVDVVSQLSAIKKVLDYLTAENNPFHSADEKEELAHYYVEKFEEELIKLLNENPAISDCSWKFKFVTDKDELKKAIDDISTGKVLNK